jgi:asparaginyl-tRNA synthetase
MTHFQIAPKQVLIDEVNGSDDHGLGFEQSPYKTPLHAVLQLGRTDKVLILIKKENTETYTEIAKSALKKLQKTLDGLRKKEAKAAVLAASAKDAVKEDKEAEIMEDTSLPKAERIKIRQAGRKKHVRVLVYGWVATVRVQSRKLVFVDLRDGSNLQLQCVLTGNLAKSQDIQELSVESAISITGLINPVISLFHLFRILMS